MYTVQADFSTTQGVIKRMHAVNNGPIYARDVDNSEDFRRAAIPSARIHDAAFCSSYGGSHCVDIPNIFPNFDADADDPASYDFDLTDEYLTRITDVGAEVFFRLGVKIEHESKKYGIYPPKDFHKWAVICEHVVRHYNEGWANGLHMGIRYWEIWNEPDLHELMWLGSDADYYRLYILTARHLKACFPQILVGGPVVTSMGADDFLQGFFAALKAEAEPVPMDFFSWHCYETDPTRLADTARKARALCDENGYPGAELILNEWNYVLGWYGQPIVDTYKAIPSARAAAFVAGCMCQSQKSPLDMLMYYDARPSTFNGLFANGTLEKLPGYYALWMWGQLYTLGGQVHTCCQGEELYSAAAAGPDGEALLVTYYPDLDHAQAAQPRQVTLDMKGFAGPRQMQVHLVDADHLDRVLFTQTTDATTCSLTLTLEPNAMVLVRTTP